MMMMLMSQGDDEAVVIGSLDERLLANADTINALTTVCTLAAGMNRQCHLRTRRPLPSFQTQRSLSLLSSLSLLLLPQRTTPFQRDLAVQMAVQMVQVVQLCLLWRSRWHSFLAIPRLLFQSLLRYPCCSADSPLSLPLLLQRLPTTVSQAVLRTW